MRKITMISFILIVSIYGSSTANISTKVEDKFDSTLTILNNRADEQSSDHKYLLNTIADLKKLESRNTNYLYILGILNLASLGVLFFILYKSMFKANTMGGVLDDDHQNKNIPQTKNESKQSRDHKGIKDDNSLNKIEEKINFIKNHLEHNLSRKDSNLNSEIDNLKTELSRIREIINEQTQKHESLVNLLTPKNVENEPENSKKLEVENHQLISNIDSAIEVNSHNEVLKTLEIMKGQPESDNEVIMEQGFHMVFEPSFKSSYDFKPTNKSSFCFLSKDQTPPSAFVIFMDKSKKTGYAIIRPSQRLDLDKNITAELFEGEIPPFPIFVTEPAVFELADQDGNKWKFVKKGKL